jgi:AhpD family alkylhydroperoxidase
MFEAIKAKAGRVPNMMRAMAAAPAVLEGYLGLSSALSRGVLDARLRERIALEVGQSNGCDYCVSAHNLLGKLAGLDEQERKQNRQGRSGDVKADAALQFARAVLERRGAVSDDQLEAVKQAGYSEAEVAEIVAHVALNVFTNNFNNTVRTPIDFPAAEPLS